MAVGKYAELLQNRERYNWRDEVPELPQRITTPIPPGANAPPPNPNPNPNTNPNPNPDPTKPPEPPKSDFDKLSDILMKLLNQGVPLPVTGETKIVPQQVSSSSPIPILLVVAGVGVIGYYIYKKKKGGT